MLSHRPVKRRSSCVIKSTTNTQSTRKIITTTHQCPQLFSHVSVRNPCSRQLLNIPPCRVRRTSNRQRTQHSHCDVLLAVVGPRVLRQVEGRSLIRPYMAVAAIQFVINRIGGETCKIHYARM